jgi:hypothetical protein
VRLDRAEILGLTLGLLVPELEADTDGVLLLDARMLGLPIGDTVFRFVELPVGEFETETEGVLLFEPTLDTLAETVELSGAEILGLTLGLLVPEFEAETDGVLLLDARMLGLPIGEPVFPIVGLLVVESDTDTEGVLLFEPTLDTLAETVELILVEADTTVEPVGVSPIEALAVSLTDLVAVGSTDPVVLPIGLMLAVPTKLREGSGELLLETELEALADTAGLCETERDFATLGVFAEVMLTEAVCMPESEGPTDALIRTLTVVISEDVPRLDTVEEKIIDALTDSVGKEL